LLQIIITTDTILVTCILIFKPIDTTSSLRRQQRISHSLAVHRQGSFHLTGARERHGFFVDGGWSVVLGLLVETLLDMSPQIAKNREKSQKFFDI
jgi:hypothetical protein